MNIDRSGITNAIKDLDTKRGAAICHNFIPMLTHDEVARFCELTGLDSFTMHQIESGLLAGAHNATTTKRNTGVDQPFATERLYDFRRAVRARIAA